MALQDDPANGSLVQFAQFLTTNKVEVNVDAKLSQMKHKFMEERESADGKESATRVKAIV